MSYYTALNYAPFTDDLMMPMGEGASRAVTGIPPGYWVRLRAGWLLLLLPLPRGCCCF